MILDSFNLQGKVAIVTGAGRGLGQGIALALAEAGADIAGVYRTSMTDTSKKIEAIGKRSLSIKADLINPDCVTDIVAKTIAEFGKVDILVNNAGMIRRSPIAEFSEKDWDEVINVNQKSLFFLSQAVAKEMIKAGNGGKIINIASMLSFQGGINVSSYTASKSAVLGITKIMANELAKHNINVNAIAPGYMATDNTKPLQDDPVRNRQILDRIPAGRWGTPDDLKGPIVFLASDASSYLQGHTMAVDGGWLSR